MRKNLIFCVSAGMMAASVLVGGCGREQPTAAKATPAEASMPAAVQASPAEPPQREQPAAQPTTTAQPTAVQPALTPPVSMSVEPAAPPAAGSSPPEDSRVANFEGLTAPKPATWIWHPVTPARERMVAAEYTIPGRDGFDQARLTIYRNIGGSPEDNILRWKQQQFRAADHSAVEPTVERFEVDGMTVVLAEFNGEYKGMGAVNFSRDHTLLAAIIPGAPAGQVILYLVGPTGTVEPNRAPFMEMIHNMRRVAAEK